MRFIVIGIVIVLIYTLNYCAPANPTEKLIQAKKNFYQNRTIFYEIINKAKLDNYPIKYLSMDTAKLIENISEKQIDWYRQKMITANINIAIQMSRYDNSIDFTIWSQGIVTSGVGVTIYYTLIPIYNQAFYQKRTMSCET